MNDKYTELEQQLTVTDAQQENPEIAQMPSKFSYPNPTGGNKGGGASNPLNLRIFSARDPGLKTALRK